MLVRVNADIFHLPRDVLGLGGEDRYFNQSPGHLTYTLQQLIPKTTSAARFFHQARLGNYVEKGEIKLCIFYLNAE